MRDIICKMQTRMVGWAGQIWGGHEGKHSAFWGLWRRKERRATGKQLRDLVAVGDLDIKV